MKTLTVRLPLSVIADLEAESRRRKITKSDVVRDRLQRGGEAAAGAGPDPLEGLRDLMGSVEGLPRDLSARKKHYLRNLRYGQNHPRG